MTGSVDNAAIKATKPAQREVRCLPIPLTSRWKGEIEETENQITPLNLNMTFCPEGKYWFAEERNALEFSSEQSQGQSFAPAGKSSCVTWIVLVSTSVVR